MARYLQCLALVVLLLSGCAGAPQRDAASAPAPATEPAAAAPSGAPTAAAVVTPNLIIDVNDLAARAPAPFICRDVLKQGSNVLVRQCMTEANWKFYRRRDAQQAAELTRMLQGSHYR